MLGRKRDKLRAFGQKLKPWHKKKNGEKPNDESAAAENASIAATTDRGTGTSPVLHSSSVDGGISPTDTRYGSAVGPKPGASSGAPRRATPPSPRLAVNKLDECLEMPKLRMKKVRSWIGEHGAVASSSTRNDVESKSEKIATDPTEHYSTDESLPVGADAGSTSPKSARKGTSPALTGDAGSSRIIPIPREPLMREVGSTGMGNAPDTAWGVDATAAILGEESPKARKIDRASWDDLKDAFMSPLARSAPHRSEGNGHGSAHSSVAGTMGSEPTTRDQRSEDTTVVTLEEPMNDKGFAYWPSSKDVPDTPSLRTFNRNMRTSRSHRSLRETLHDVMKGLQRGSWTTIRGMGRRVHIRAPIPTFAPTPAVNTREH